MTAAVQQLRRVKMGVDKQLNARIIDRWSVRARDGSRRRSEEEARLAVERRERDRATAIQRQAGRQIKRLAHLIRHRATRQYLQRWHSRAWVARSRSDNDRHSTLQRIEVLRRIRYIAATILREASFLAIRRWSQSCNECLDEISYQDRLIEDEDRRDGAERDLREAQMLRERLLRLTFEEVPHLVPMSIYGNK
jgi:hypothetical protein